MIDLKNTSKDDLFDIVNKCLDDLDTSLYEACVALYELEKRGHRHSATRLGIFKYFREIAEGRLDAKAAYVFEGLRPVLKSVMRTPIATQKELAQGLKITVVNREPAGDFNVERLPILRMNRIQLKWAIGPKGLRSAEAQMKLMEQEKYEPPQPTETRTPVVVGRDGKFLFAPNRIFTVNDLITPLKELGYTIERIEA